LSTSKQPDPRKRTATAAAPAPDGFETPTQAARPGAKQRIPVLDLQKIGEIHVDTGRPELAINFLSDFMKLLQARMSRILAALTAEDPQASVKATLRLKNTANMAGAPEIEGHCINILARLAARDFELSRASAAALKRCVDRMTSASPILLDQVKIHLASNPPTPQGS
jgi:HPt (histidine-containing phosphotransfer) domain-containing protein